MSIKKQLYKIFTYLLTNITKCIFAYTTEIYIHLNVYKLLQ